MGRNKIHKSKRCTYKKNRIKRCKSKRCTYKKNKIKRRNSNKKYRTKRYTSKKIRGGNGISGTTYIKKIPEIPVTVKLYELMDILKNKKKSIIIFVSPLDCRSLGKNYKWVSSVDVRKIWKSKQSKGKVDSLTTLVGIENTMEIGEYLKRCTNGKITHIFSSFSFNSYYAATILYQYLHLTAIDFNLIPYITELPFEVNRIDPKLWSNIGDRDNIAKNVKEIISEFHGKCMELFKNDMGLNGKSVVEIEDELEPAKNTLKSTVTKLLTLYIKDKNKFHDHQKDALVKAINVLLSENNEKGNEFMDKLVKDAEEIITKEQQTMTLSEENLIKLKKDDLSLIRNNTNKINKSINEIEKLRKKIFILKELELPTIRVDPNTTVKKASDLKPDSDKSLEYLSTFFKKIAGGSDKTAAGEVGGKGKGKLILEEMLFSERCAVLNGSKDTEDSYILLVLPPKLTEKFINDTSDLSNVTIKPGSVLKLSQHGVEGDTGINIKVDQPKTGYDYPSSEIVGKNLRFCAENRTFISNISLI